MKKIVILLLFVIPFCFSSCKTLEIFSKKEEPKSPVPVVYGNINHGSSIYVTGKGIADKDSESTEAYLLAERAAIIDGYRLLSEKLAGILLQASSKNENYKLSSDTIMSQTQSYVRGAEIVNIIHNENGIVEVQMKLQLPTDISKILAKN
jgi:hypothetical protein